MILLITLTKRKLKHEDFKIKIKTNYQRRNGGHGREERGLGRTEDDKRKDRRRPLSRTG